MVLPPPCRPHRAADRAAQVNHDPATRERAPSCYEFVATDAIATSLD